MVYDDGEGLPGARPQIAAALSYPSPPPIIHAKSVIQGDSGSGVSGEKWGGNGEKRRISDGADECDWCAMAPPPAVCFSTQHTRPGLITWCGPFVAG